MKVQEVNNKFYLLNNTVQKVHVGTEQVSAAVNNPSNISNDLKGAVSFKGNSSNFTKYFWYRFKKLSNYMKNDNEMTNAAIAAIGTGFIAPFAIMCSPGKKCNKEDDKANAKSKKKFQALRQPVSAALAFFFQMPTTIGIKRGFKYLAYKKHWKVFDDETLKQLLPGERHYLIPDKKYLEDQANKIINGKASPEVMEQWGETAGMANKFADYKDEFINKIKQEYEDVGINLSQSELEEKVNNRRTELLSEKMAGERHKKLIDEKVSELSGKKFEIKDIDLVTEKYQDLARERYKSEFEALEKNAKLSWFDTCLKYMGFSHGKLAKLDKAQKELAKRYGLQELKIDMPELFREDNYEARLRKFVETNDAKAQKHFGNKIFWLSLLTNLAMVAISCVALNKLHPKFADYMDKHFGKNKNDNTDNSKKVEVKA